jgi:glycosyltransferase involved in cell wall biosynthesis
VTKKRKVLVLGSYPAPYRVDVFKGLAKEYDTKVFFATQKNENRSKEWFVKNDELSFSVLDNPRAQVEFKNALKKIKEFDFVIAYDSLTKPALRAVLLCRLNGIPYFVNADGAILKKDLIRDAVKRFVFKGAKRCFSSGRITSRYFMYYGVDSGRIVEHHFSSLHEEDILNCLPEKAEKSRLRAELGIPEKTTVLSVGQFIPRKGFDILLKAWRDFGDEANLIIIGGGDEKPLYEEYISNHGISGVQLIDFMSKSEIFKYYKAADIFVLPTREDIWGLVINEAMANGLPVITTDNCVAGLELIENDVNGYMVKNEDPFALSEKIQYLIDNPEKRENMGRANLEKIKNWTIENIVELHIFSINEIIDN